FREFLPNKNKFSFLLAPANCFLIRSLSCIENQRVRPRMPPAAISSCVQHRIQCSQYSTPATDSPTGRKPDLHLARCTRILLVSWNFSAVSDSVVLQPDLNLYPSFWRVPGCS